MGFEASLWELLHSLVLLQPLILHLVFQILADLEVLVLFQEDSLDKYLENVFEVDLLVFAHVSLSFIRCQDLNNVFVLNDYKFFFIHIN